MTFFPAPKLTLDCLQNHINAMGRRVVCATLEPRTSWDGDGFDIAWTGKVITTNGKTLASWSYTMRVTKRNAGGISTYGGWYDIPATEAGLTKAIGLLDQPGPWLFNNDHGEWNPSYDTAQCVRFGAYRL